MTTTAAAVNKGGSSNPASPTGKNGGESGARDASSSATEAVETPSPKSGRAAIAADIESMKAEAADEAAAETTVDGQTDGADKKAEAQNDAKPEGDKPSKDDNGKVDDVKKVRAEMKERLKRADKKFEDLKGQLHARDLEHKKSVEALRLAVAEVDRLTGLLKQGAKYDEKGEKIVSMELADKARAAAEKLDQESKKAIEQAREQAATEVEGEALQGEFQQALAAHDLVGFAELKDAYGKEIAAAIESKGTMQPRTVAEVAAALEDEKLNKARGKLVKERPAHPSSVRGQRAGGTKSQVDYSHDKRGIAEHIDALKRQHG